MTGRQQKVTKSSWVHTPKLSREWVVGTWHFWTLTLDCFHTVYRFNQSDRAPTKALCSQCVKEKL